MSIFNNINNAATNASNTVQKTKQFAQDNFNQAWNNVAQQVKNAASAQREKQQAQITTPAAPRQQNTYTVTGSKGKQYTFDEDAANWIVNRYWQDNAKSYGLDDADQLAKKNGQISASMLKTYKNTNVDRQLAAMGLPSEKNLEKYLGDYYNWKTGGMDEVFGQYNLPNDYWTKSKNYFQEDWQNAYENTAEDRERKAKGLLPAKYEAKYTDTEIDEQLKARGLPPVSEFYTYQARYNNGQEKEQLYANAALAQTNLRLQGIKDDDTEYNGVKGKDLYAQAFYKEAMRKNADGTYVYGDIMPNFQGGTSTVKTPELTGNYATDQANQLMAEIKGSAKETSTTNSNSWDYDDYLSKYPEYYEKYFANQKLPGTDQLVSDALAVQAREADPEATKSYYDVDNSWFGASKKGLQQLVTEYEKDNPKSTPYDMFSDMLKNGVSITNVRKIAKTMQKEAAQSTGKNRDFYAISDALVRAENNWAHTEELDAIYGVNGYDVVEGKVIPKGATPIVTAPEAEAKTFFNFGDAYANASKEYDSSAESAKAEQRVANRSTASEPVDDELYNKTKDVIAIYKSAVAAYEDTAGNGAPSAASREPIDKANKMLNDLGFKSIHGAERYIESVENGKQASEQLKKDVTDALRELDDAKADASLKGDSKSLQAVIDAEQKVTSLLNVGSADEAREWLRTGELPASEATFNGTAVTVDNAIKVVETYMEQNGGWNAKVAQQAFNELYRIGVPPDVISQAAAEMQDRFGEMEETFTEPEKPDAPGIDSMLDYVAKADASGPDESTVEDTKKAIERLLFDEDGNNIVLTNADSVIKAIDSVRQMSFTNPAAVDLALKDLGFSTNGWFSGVADDLTNGWSTDEMVKLRLALGEERAVGVNPDDYLPDDAKFIQDTFGLDDFWMGNPTSPSQKILRQDAFATRLEWANQQIQAGTLTPGKAYNVLAEDGYHDELEILMGDEWHKAHFKEYVAPDLWAQSVESDRLLWDEMSEAERDAAAERMWEALSDEQKAAKYGDPSWWKYDSTVKRTAGQAWTQQTAAILPGFLTQVFATTPMTVIDAVDAAITGRPEAWDATKKLTEVQTALSKYGSVEDFSLGTRSAEWVTSAAQELLKMETLGNLGGLASEIFTGTGVGSKVINAAASNSKVVQKAASLITSMIKASPFVAESFAGHYMEAKERGATNGEAWFYGATCGIGEGVFEWVNFDKLWGKAIGSDRFVEELIQGGLDYVNMGVNGKLLLSSLALSSLGEATEEFSGYNLETLEKIALYSGKGLGEKLGLTPWAEGTEYSMREGLEQAFVGGLLGLFGAGLHSGSITTRSLITDYAIDKGNVELFRKVAPDLAYSIGVAESLTKADLDMYKQGGARIMSLRDYGQVLGQIDDCEDGIAKANDEIAKIQADAQKPVESAKAELDKYDVQLAPYSDTQYGLTGEQFNEAVDLDNKRAAAEKVYEATKSKADEDAKAASQEAQNLLNNSKERMADLQKQVQEHWVGIYLQNYNSIINGMTDEMVSNLAQAYRDGSMYDPMEMSGRLQSVIDTLSTASENVNDPNNIRWFSKKSKLKLEGATAREFTADDEAAVINAAEKLKYRGKVSFVDDPNAKWNGRISLDSGNIIINKARLTAYDKQKLQSNPGIWILEHELNHFMKSRGGKNYAEFHNAVVDMLKNSEYIKGNEKKYNAVLDDMIAGRRENGMGELTRAQAEEELVGNFAMEYLFDSEDAVKSLFQTNGTVGERILSWLRYKINRAKLRRSKESWAREILDVERMYAKALRETRNKPQSTESKGEVKSNNGEAYYASDTYRPGEYDYTKPFKQQLQDVKDGRFPWGQDLLVGYVGDSDELMSVGISNLPVSYSPGHANTALSENADSAHKVDIDTLAQMPEAIKHPIAIIKSGTRNDSIVILTDLMRPANEYEKDKNGKYVLDDNGNKKEKLDENGNPIPAYNENDERINESRLAAIRLDGRPRINGRPVDSLHVASFYPKPADILKTALEAEEKGKPSVFYVDMKKASDYLAQAGLQLPSGYKVKDGFIRSINDPDSPVKFKGVKRTESSQFDNWFGSERNPQTGKFADPSKVSKFKKGVVTDSQGNERAVPVTMYRVPGTEYTYTTRPSGPNDKGYYLNANRLITQEYIDSKLIPQFGSEEAGIYRLVNSEGRKRAGERFARVNVLEDGSKQYKIYDKGDAKLATEGYGLYDRTIKNEAYSYDDESLDFLGDYKGVANPYTGVTAEQDAQYMAAALAGDVLTCWKLVRDMYMRNGYTHMYHGDQRPGGSYDTINWDELDEQGRPRYRNRQLFGAEQERFDHENGDTEDFFPPSMLYVGEHNTQDQQYRPFSYGREAELDMLNEYVADINDFLKTNYEVDAWFTDKNGKVLSDEEVKATDTKDLVPHYALYDTDDGDEPNYILDEDSPSMLARRVFEMARKKRVDSAYFIENPLAGGVIGLFVKGNRTNETRGYNQNWNQIPYEGEFPEEYRYDTITLHKDKATKQRTLTAVKSDGTVLTETVNGSGQQPLIDAFTRMFGEGNNVAAEMFGWDEKTDSFQGVGVQVDDENFVAHDVVVDPDTHQVYERGGIARVTDDIGVEDRANGYDLSRITNIFDGGEMPGNVLIARNENFIKSSDPIMYDKKGDIVPLHKRGNEFVNELYSGDDASIEDLLSRATDENRVINPRTGVTVKESDEYSEAFADYAVAQMTITYSDPVFGDEYDEAGEADAIERADKLVRTVAARNKYTTDVFHGTNMFGFTKPNTAYSDDSLSFFTAASPRTAKTYMADEDSPTRGEYNSFVDDNGKWLGYDYDSTAEADIKDISRAYSERELRHMSDSSKAVLHELVTQAMIKMYEPYFKSGKLTEDQFAEGTPFYNALKDQADELVAKANNAVRIYDNSPQKIANMVSKTMRDTLKDFMRKSGFTINDYDQYPLGDITANNTRRLFEPELDRDVWDKEDAINGVIDSVYLYRSPDYIEALENARGATLREIATDVVEEAMNIGEAFGIPLDEITRAYFSEGMDTTPYYWSDAKPAAAFVRDYLENERDRLLYETYNPSGGTYHLLANTEGMVEVGDENEVRNWNEVTVPEWAITGPTGMEALNIDYFEQDRQDGTKRYAATTRNIAEWAAYNGYRGVIYKNITDNGGRAPFDVNPDTVYNFFFPEKQLRSADTFVYDDNGELIPLDKRFDPNSPDPNVDPNDWRWSSSQDPEVSEMLERYGTGSNITTEQAQNRAAADAQLAADVRRYGAIEQGRYPRVRDVDVPRWTDQDNRVSRWIRSLVESGKLTDEQAQNVLRMVVEQNYGTYVPTSQGERMAEARAYIAERQPLQAQQEFHDMVMQGKFGVKTNALGIQLLSDASARGDIESVLELAADLQVAATEAGQSAQIFNVLKELKGIGSAWYMQRVIDRLNAKYADRIAAGKMDKITVDQALMAELAKATTVDQIAKAEEDVAKDVARQIPLTWDDRLSNWRYFSMLANPTTHARNFFGNLLMKGLNTAKDAVATGLENVLGVDQSDRAHAIITQADHNAWGDWVNQSYKEQARNLSGGSKLGFESFVKQNMRSFDTKFVNALAQFNFKALEGEDIAFIRPAYKNALMQYMKAQGYTLNEKGKAGKVNAKGQFREMSKAEMNEATEWASQQAWKQTFRDASSLATMLNKLSKENAVSRLLIEGVMPFKKTPINIAKRGIEYSPAGIIMGIAQLTSGVKKGKVTTAQAIDNLASGLTGSALMALGVMLAKMGVIRAGGEKDKKLETFLEDTGDQTYAMKFGDKSINMSSIAPATIPLFMGVALNEMIEQGGDSFDLSTIADVLAGTLNPFMEMSFMASLNSALQNYNQNGIGGALGNTIMTAAQNYGSQFLPTLGGKVAQFIDPTRRSTKSDITSPLGSNLDYYGRSLAKKVPGLESTLQPDVDVWGRTDKKDTFGEWAWDFANKFILPTNVKTTNRDAVDNELIRIVESTGVTDFLPSDGNKYFTVNKQRIEMNAKQYAQYSQDRGQAAYAALKDVMSSMSYKNASDEEKAELLRKAKEAACKQVNNLWKDKLGAY